MNSAFPFCTGPALAPLDALQAIWPGAPRGLPAWPLPPGRVVATHAARVAIALVCRAGGRGAGDEALVPAYNCGTEVDALLSSGLDVRLYRVDRAGHADWDDCRRRVTARTRLVYVTHYFGWPQPLGDLPSWCATRGLRLLEDCALALFSSAADGPVGSGGDAAVFSLPKTLPVPDGGLLVLRSMEPLPPLAAAPAWRVRRRSLPLLKNACLNWSGMLRRGYAGWRTRRALSGNAATARFSDLPGSYYFDVRLRDRAISAFSARLLWRCAPDAVVAQRRANYQRLAAQLPAVTVRPLFPDLPLGVCPLALPVLVRDRDQLCRQLWCRGITAIPWWAGQHRALDSRAFPEAIGLKSQVLALPVHQQLGAAEMDAIGAVLRDLAVGNAAVSLATPAAAVADTAAKEVT